MNKTFLKLDIHLICKPQTPSFLHPLFTRMLKYAVATSTVILLGACANVKVANNIANSEDTRKENNQFTVQLLGINDFHGQIPDLSEQGGMYQLSRHLLHAIESSNEKSFILHAGDQVGASPAESALLQDEPAIDFLNILQAYCLTKKPQTCEIIGAAGNHEFDEGSDEMLRLLDGGNHANGPFIHPQWQGANYTTLGANIRDINTNELILPPYVVREVNNVPIGFIGITLDITPEVVIPGIVDNLVFQNQAEVVNHYAIQLEEQGVNAIVVIVHDGSADEYYEGETSPTSGIREDSRFGRFIKALPNSVDVLVTGHSHRFTNAYVANNTGKQFLVTQAFSSGRAYSDISITIDKTSKDIVKSSAKVVMTHSSKDLQLSDQTLGVLRDISALKTEATDFAKDLTQELIGNYEAGSDDISLGQFIADSHRLAVQADVGIMNRGGVRAKLNEGNVTWGDVFAIQPFSNPLVKRKYSGKQLMALINQQNHWSSNVDINEDDMVLINNKAIVPSKIYTVSGNAFILNSEAFSEGELVGIFGVDVDATINYIKSFGANFSLQSRP